MAYCRWGESDFYVYGTRRDGICIHGPDEDGDKMGLTPQEALNYLTAQREAGRAVPQHAIDRLRHEIDMAERTLEANLIDLM